MLLPWRDEVRVLLTPSRVYLRRLARGVAQPAADAAADVLNDDSYDWKPAVDTLAGLLPQRSGRVADAHLVLSNHFVHYCVVPNSDLLVTREDASQLARHLCTRIFGPQADSWNFRVSHGKGQSTLCSCVDTRLIEALRALLQAHGLRPRSLQPALMAAFNAARAKLPAGHLRLVFIEPGVAVSAQLNGGWRWIGSQRIAEAEEGEIDRLLDRQRSLVECDSAAETICMVPLLPEQMPMPAGGTAPLRVLPPFWSLAETGSPAMSEVTD